jgi:hypothetical protein
MTRRPNNLNARLDRLERFRRPKGTPFFMIWGKNESELTDAVSKAKANGDLRVGDKYDTKIWTNPTEPPPPRFVTLADMEREELTIIAGKENQPPPNNSERSALIGMTDADLSDWYAGTLPLLA